MATSCKVQDVKLRFPSGHNWLRPNLGWPKPPPFQPSLNTQKKKHPTSLILTAKITDMEWEDSLFNEEQINYIYY